LRHDDLAGEDRLSRRYCTAAGTGPIEATLEHGTDC
jgi:hypothetical protein